MDFRDGRFHVHEDDIHHQRIIEASQYEALRLGEALPPPARSLLEHLDVWPAFQTQRHCQVYGTMASWGSAALVDNDFFLRPANTGWHLDRTAFDAMLARAAQSRGATLLLNRRVRDCRHVGNEWKLTLSPHESLSARFLVDATGGSGALAPRCCGARLVEIDKLVSIVAFYEACNAAPTTSVEAFADGWWYTAGLPNGKRIVACMTDADLVRSLCLHDPEAWRQRLGTMPRIAATLQGGKTSGQVKVRSISSRRLDPAAGADWLAVGDAASRFDPLSSQGIFKALQSGIFAAYVIGDLLVRRDEAGRDRFCRYVREEFNSYTEVRTTYYREEQRWPERPFWRRRHACAAN
jgi:flavin-dependent dehydrogenase